MSRTPQEIASLLNQFIGQYAGNKADYYGYLGECLSLAKRWFDTVKNGNLNGQMTAPPSANWGSDYWVSPPGSVLELFDKVNYDPNATYPEGSLFVNTGTHHIGILISNNPGSTTATVFEQNADPDGSPAHTAQRSKSKIDGILLIRTEAPAPAAPTISVTAFAAPQQFTVTGDKWNLGLPNFEAIAANPVSGAPSQPVTVTAYLTRSDLPQYVYYLEDSNVHQGYNKLDCTPYTPPPQPYVPPAAPVNVPKITTYDLLITVVYFDTAADAKAHVNAKGVVTEGTYIDLRTDGLAKQITKKNTDTVTYWINTNDNKLPEPVTQPIDPPKVQNEPVQVTASLTVLTDVTPAKKEITWGWLNADRQPTIYRYKGSTPVPIKDLEGTKPSLTMNAGLKGPISRYTIVNGMEYLIPDSEFKKNNCYGIPSMLMEPVQESFLEEAEHDVIDWADKLIEMPRKAYTIIADVTPVRISHAAQKGKQFIDGFNKRKVK